MSQQAQPKYIFEKGVMKLNPKFVGDGTPPTTLAKPSQALAIVSSTADIMAASEAQERATGKPMELSEATTASMEIIQDEGYIAQFKSKHIRSQDLIEGLTRIFAQYEVPVGLLN